MPKYRKRPVVIEAVRLTERTEIRTLEGVMVGNAGDWLITGVKGERYPCKPDIFEATYEPAESQTDFSRGFARGVQEGPTGVRRKVEAYEPASGEGEDDEHV